MCAKWLAKGEGGSVAPLAPAHALPRHCARLSNMAPSNPTHVLVAFADQTR